MKKKKYVNEIDNVCPEYMQDHFGVGSKVIVSDGSYMVNADKTKANPHGCDFTIEGKFELLTVTRINIPFRTNYNAPFIGNVLGHHNNCEIQGNDGERYYCSHINIVRYE